MIMTPDNAVVRKTTPADRDAIVALVLAAFSSVDHDGHEEVKIVASTWELGATALDLECVAVMDEVIVGHVLAAWGDLGSRDRVAVAPLAVLPSHQGLGSSTALMTELLRRAELAALPLVVLLGHPEFYDRFRFEASGPLGIAYRAVDQGNPHFKVRRFGGYDESYRGDFRHAFILRQMARLSPTLDVVLSGSH